MKIAVVGGGVAGLAAALRLRELAPAAEIIVLEQSDRPGGKLRTGALTAVDGSELPFELGAENFLARDPATGGDSAAVELVRRLGLGAELVHPDLVPAALAVGGALLPMPRATLMGIPARVDALGGVAKVDAGRDRDAGHPLLAPGQDTAVGALVRQRFGDEVVDRLVDPLLGGVYAGRADHLSLAATMAGLATAATTEHTLIAAVHAAMEASAAHRPAPGSPVFATVAGGLGRLIEVMASRVEVRLGAAVSQLLRSGPGGWRLVLGPASSPEVIEADAVILAVPASPAANLLGDEYPESAAYVGVLDYASLALVTLVLPATELPDLSGILVPAGEGFDMKAATFFTRKWPHLRRTDGTVLIRASIGRYGEEHVLRRDDDELTRVVHDELSTLLGGRLAAPVDSVVQRWDAALPQYAPGHLDRVARARSALRAGSPPLALAGAAYDGVGIPACVRSGETAAGEIFTALGGRAE